MRFFITKTLPVCLLGLAAGFLNGLLGAGGGIVIVLGLSQIQKHTSGDPRSVYASAIAVMLPLSLVSVWRYAQMGHMDVAAMSALALPAIAGGAVGAWLLRRLSPRALARLFAALVLVSGIVLVI